MKNTISILTLSLATSAIIAQAKPAAPAKPVGPVTAAQSMPPAPASGKKNDAMRFAFSAFGGISLALPKSKYSTELESSAAKSGAKQEIAYLAPTGGAAFWYGNSQWQAGLSGTYLQAYKNSTTVGGTSYTTALTYITGQVLFRYFVFEGAYAGLGLGIGYGTLKQENVTNVASLKSRVVPVAALKLGYDYDLPDLGVTVGGFVDVSYYLATITDSLGSGSIDYNANNLAISPGVMVGYKF